MDTYIAPGIRRIVNLTPHAIVLLGGVNGRDAPSHAFPSVGEARATTRRVAVDRVSVPDLSDGPLPKVTPAPEDWHGDWWTVDVCRLEFGPVEGLPDPEPGVRLIVSRIAAEAARAHGRATDDLLIPDDLVRGPDGQPIGCRGFARV